MTRTRGELRIVGGVWRSRRLRVPAGPRLRPTPDRVRETLFNWLSPWIEGRRVLDLFAGSGALGLEALSRGASEAVLVDDWWEAVVALRSNAAILGAEAATVVHSDALRFLAGRAKGFDLVFLDPPFAGRLLRPVLERLWRPGARLLAPDARIYVEYSAKTAFESLIPPLPSGWAHYRDIQAGDVSGCLLVCQDDENQYS